MINPLSWSIQPAATGQVGLYIHLPFCKRKCLYCDFYSVSPGDFTDYLKALCDEIELHHPRRLALQSIFFGGGTPSLAPLDFLSLLLGRVRDRFNLPPALETTIECNPESVDQVKAAAWHSLGFNRVSVGVQSFFDDELQLLGRLHDARQARRAVHCLQEAGGENLSLDLMFGLPGQSVERWRQNLEEALSFNPKHLSCYGLTLEPHSPLGRQYGPDFFPEELYRQMFLLADEVLTGAGYEHYEISNYALPGYECQHNLNTWRGGEYLGLGPAAHSYMNGERFANAKSMDDYLQRDLYETLDWNQILQEAVYLGLRTNRGLSVSEFFKKYEIDLYKKNGPLLHRLETEGLLEWFPGKDRFRLTAKGYLLTDEVAVEIAL